MKRLKEFEKGVLYSAGLMAAVGETTYAAEIIRQAGLECVNVTSMDEYDKSNLRLLNNEGLSLKGLSNY